VLHALRPDDADLGEMPAQSVERRRALASEQLARSMAHQFGLVVDRTHWHEALARPAHRLSDGTIVAIGNPNLKQALGTDMRAAQNSTGEGFGAEMYAASQKPEGQITEVSYMSPKPGADDAIVAKVSLVARADK
jgi:hypothetical protein